jgi:hypothetical protein
MQTFKMFKVILESRQWGNTSVCVFSMFENSVTSVEVAVPSGCQSTSKTGENMDQVKDFFLKIRIMNIFKLLMLEISFGSVLSILRDSLNMHQIAAKFVPYVLTEDQEKIMSAHARTF